MYYDGVIVKPPIEQLLIHSGIKGMEWKNHKYIRKANGTYFYPEGSGKNRSTYAEYKKGDPDFDRKNFSEKNRLGDTDFFGFTKPDGTVVILEEDMKWTLPKGTKIDANLISRLETFDKEVESKRNKGEKFTADDWEKMAKRAIDGDSGSNELSDKDIDDLANEVIRGNFANGQERKDLLGEDYQKVQDVVNQKLNNKSTKSSTTPTSSTKESKSESDYEVKEGNNHYKYKVKKK